MSQSEDVLQDEKSILAKGQFQAFLKVTSLALLGHDPLSPQLLIMESLFDQCLKAEACTSKLLQFISDSSIRVLQIHWIETKKRKFSEVDDCQSLQDQKQNNTPKDNVNYFYLNLGMEYQIEQKKQDHEVICFIKRKGMMLTCDQLFRHQLEIMTLGLSQAVSRKSFTKSSVQEMDECEEKDEDFEQVDVLSVVYNYIHQSLGPLVQEYSKAHHSPKELTNANKASRGLPGIRRRMKELELALLQYQQNIEIPEVKLLFYPLIHQAAQQVRQKGTAINVEALGLEEKLQDAAVLNEIQAGVNRWIKEIQKLTKLVNEPLPGTTMQEINFWCDLHRELVRTQELLSSPEVEITMMLLKRAKRYLVTVTFTSDHGLNTAIQQVQSVMSLMKDFPMNAILSATDLDQLTQGVLSVFTHLKRIRVADEYKISRLMHLLEVISGDLALQIQSLIRAQKLLQMPFENFQSLVASCKELFTTWHRQVGMLYETARELSKRRGTTNTDKAPSLSDLHMEHLAIEERVLQLNAFRDQHEKLRRVIEQVIQSAVTEASDESDDIDANVLTEIQDAYGQMLTLDLLDVSTEGGNAWIQMRKSYDMCIDRVEGKITASLTTRLSTTSSADEMFRVFSKYNALFFRPRIRTAVQQFQMQLIEKVKEDVGKLQAKFRAHYAYSEASRTSKLRDIPPVSGAIMWARQMERKLKILLYRVESVLGLGWEQHVEGKALKVATEAFMSRLNPQLIFDQWVTELASMPIFDIKNIIMNIVTAETSKGVQKKLVVAFSHQIVTLFKEVRNLDWLGFRVPFTLKMIAEDAKSKYPQAMSLNSSLQTYMTAYHRIQPMYESLAAAYVKEFRAVIGKVFTKGNEIRWHADGLGDYVADVAMKAERLHDRVEEVSSKCEVIRKILIKLTESDDIEQEVIRAEIAKIQSVVDELSLSGYSNLNLVATKLNEQIGEILAKKLQHRLKAWIELFEIKEVRADPDERRDMESAKIKINELVKELKLTSKTHQLVLRNQTLSLVPSLDQAREYWLSQLHELTKGLCTMEKVQASTFDNVYGPGGVGFNSLSSPNTRRRAALVKRKDASFGNILHILPGPLIKRAFAVVNDMITDASVFADSWLQYQTLWDMDAQAAINSIGKDIQKWQQILMEIKHERSSFDAVSDSKRFGPLLINYQQVQAQINVKYDAWHNEFIAHFAELLCNQVNEFYSTISTKRTQLEQHVLEAATAQVVSAVTLVQEMKVMQVAWEKSIESFAQGENLLKRQRYKFNSTWPSLANVEGEWEAFLQLLERKSTAISSQLPQLQAKVIEEKSGLEQRILNAITEWDLAKPLRGDQSPKKAIDIIVVYASRFNMLDDELDKMKGAIVALNLSLYSSAGTIESSSFMIKRAQEELSGLNEVWNNLLYVSNRINELQDTLWSAVQPRKIRRQLESLIEDMRKFPALVQQYEAFEHFVASIQQKKAITSRLADLKLDAIRERHWKHILRLLEIASPFSELTLRHFWESKINQHDGEVKNVIRTAQGEMALDEFLRQISEHWTNFTLELVNYRNRCRIIRGWDEMLNKLEEHVNSLASMKQSPFYRVFADVATNWEEKLNRVRAILDIWIDVQRRWVYLEGIFLGSADIKLQLPKEFSRFQSIDNEFLTLMKRVAHKPQILEVTSIPNLYHNLERQQELMNNIQRALGEYLERQRSTFPRFYFVGDEDLLEIIGNSKEPLQVQRHLSKMFAGIASLQIDLESPHIIRGMISREGEIVPFREPVIVNEDSRINVWLSEVEKQMRDTLSHLLAVCISSYPDVADHTAYLRWVHQYPAQVIVLATQVHFSSAVEESWRSNVDPPDKFSHILKALDKTLLITSEQVLQDIKPETRTKYEQLITEIVHEKSVVRRLNENHIEDVNDFQWIYRMRYYFHAEESDPLKRLCIKISNAEFCYGFEYLGVGERLVQTPLTERCYLTLTQALDLGLGGNPFGPAGTGKTESVKALGAQLGRFVLVFNCDEHFDFQAMGRIFVGLCQVGAWGCFDEFNRLEERVLSAVSQQILTIQMGLSRLKEKNDSTGDQNSNVSSVTIELLGKNILLNADIGIFVTMNPGYAGRSNLPDNLKQLFRSIAMVAPDRELIAQVLLFSQGISIAETVAAKVVLLFQMCEDQLSKQPHYDFGLRALKSVLASAGYLKRKALSESTKDIKSIETEALMGSIVDTVLPKLVSSDVSLFEGVFCSVFPDAVGQNIHDLSLEEDVHRSACAKDFVLHKPWIKKILQLHQVMQLRHGVMLVGSCASGKSSAWRILLDALNRHDGRKGEAHVIEPKALTKEHLYGKLDSTTLEWTDGVFTSILRQISNSVRGESEKRHWIIFDGDVDPEWAENLNSVLDDNRILTLPSGERLEIPPNVWIMMETETLRYATLATVSRCGMVWFSEETIEFCHMVEHEFRCIANSAMTVSFPSDTNGAIGLAAYYAQELRDFISHTDGTSRSLLDGVMEYAIGLKHIMKVCKARLLMSLFSLVSRGLDCIYEYNESHSDFMMTRDQVSTYCKKWFVYSMVWGFGSSMDSESRLKLCECILHTFETRVAMPVDSTSTSGYSLLDYELVIETADWRPWAQSVPQLHLESHRILATDIVVPTVDTIRHVHVLRGWLSLHRPLILCGPPGSGKTMTLTSTLSSLPQLDFASLNFSSGTSPDLILKTFYQYCEFKRTPNGMVLSPNSPEKWLVVFCDEVNLPEADKYGTQRVILFLRQMIEQEGFWLGSKNCWVTLQRIQFVGACNPPTDPGRVPLSLRFLRHAPVLLVDFPTTPSLTQIYGTFNRALLKLTPSLKAYAEPLTNSMVDIYQKNQIRFTIEQRPHYIYSPRELSRWMRALYEAIEPLEYEMDVENLVRLVFHEALRLFMDRLATSNEQEWCFTSSKEVLRYHFPQTATSLNAIDYKSSNPVLFSTWLSKRYVEVAAAELRKHVEARLRVFYEEELNVPLVVFDSVLEHVLRIDRVLRQPLGHLLLVGESGVGKTVLSRFVSWVNGMSVFQIKLTSKYTLENFDEDLRVVLKRSGCEGEKICFIFDESNILSSAFLERMNALLASGEVPGLFEDDEYVSLMHACREAVQRDGVIVENNEDELFRYFTRQVQRNLHVVFTMNPASGDFQGRQKTSPALFNRCVVDWFGTWNDKALAQVAQEFTKSLDLAGSDTFVIPNEGQKLLSHLLPSFSSSAMHDALVGAIVEVHHATLEHMHRMQKRHLRYNHISPRDFLELIRHFLALYNEKKAHLEEQQLHLNVGVQKLQATHEQVAELQAQLSVKEKQLKRNNEEANAKLQQMVHEQNEAENKKRDTEKLAADLAQQEAEITSRKVVVEGDLARAEPALLDAQQSVNSIRKSQLDEIRALARPPAAIRMTLEAVAVMLGESSLDWADLRKFIRRDDFISQVVNFESAKLSVKQRNFIQTNYTAKSDEFEYEKVNRASRACGPLFKWVISQLQYTDILHRVQPLRREVQELEDKSADLRQRYLEAKTIVDDLEVRIEKYKQEYASLISDAQKISKEMEQVNQKVARSVALLDSLLHESERWGASAGQFELQMATLTGDTLLSAAFLTYAGFLDFQQRKILTQDWKDISNMFGIHMREQLNFAEYLSQPHQRLEWQMSDLPADELCYENAIILQRFRRFPLIIDPSGQANQFITQYYALKTSLKIAQTSFLDSSFIKVLASAIRFGTALLVHDVENIDPILNPVLNRELYKTGGRTLIRLAGEEIDYSPDFCLFMITRNSSCRFSPDICSRVTFVNFTVTPNSLENQSLSILIKSEEPQVEEKRTNLLKMQGAYQAKLRELENLLLQQINNAQGNILDDNTVILSLEKMKAEASQISIQAAETREAMKVVNEATNRYRPLAKACSTLFFALESLSSVHFLYQYSLQFFLDLLTCVLSSANRDSIDQGVLSTADAKLSKLASALFSNVSSRVSRGLLERDKLMFALKLAQVFAQCQEETRLMNMKISKGQDRTLVFPTELEWDVLVSKFASATHLRDLDAKIKDALGNCDEAHYEGFGKLIKSGIFPKLEEHVLANAAEWILLLRHTTPEKVLPNGWDTVCDDESHQSIQALFRTMVLINYLRPDRVLTAGENFIHKLFGAEFPWRGEIDLYNNMENDTSACRAILLCSIPGYDASTQIDELAIRRNKKYSSVSMGSPEGFDVAEKSINTALKQGSWLLLRNVHLCPSWLSNLENKLYNTRNSAHTDFRLFLTSEIQPSLPLNLIRLCDVYVFEPPGGMKLSMIRSFESIPSDRFDAGPVERARLFYLLAWFHALVQERLRYVPIGWSKAYEFSQADFRAACDVIDRWVDKMGAGRVHLAPNQIPWIAIRTTLSQAIYGGRVDNEFDQKLLNTLLDSTFTAESYQITFQLVGNSKDEANNLIVAEGKTKAQFFRWVQALPNSNSPVWLGLPESAEQMLQIKQGEYTMRKLQLLQDAYGIDDIGSLDQPSRSVSSTEITNGEEPKWMSAIGEHVMQLLNTLPNKLPIAAAKGINHSDCIMRCIFRECQHANLCLEAVKEALDAIASVCHNQTRPSSQVEEDMRNLSRGKIPSAWRSLYTTSIELGINEWFHDFCRRLTQLRSILDPAAQSMQLSQDEIWLGGLFFPEAYVAGLRQNAADSLQCPLNELYLVAAADFYESSANSIGVIGVRSEGAVLMTSGMLPSDNMSTSIPIFYLYWTRQTENSETMRRVPVYNTVQRDRLLFIVHVKADHALFPEAQWHQRSVALVLWNA